MGRPGKLAADFAVALCAVAALLWTVTLVCPQGWHYANIYYTYRLESGLYGMKVSRDVIGHAVSMTGSNANSVMKFAEGFHSLHDVTQRICAGKIVEDTFNMFMGSNGDTTCDAMQKMQIAAVIQMISGVIVVILLSCAALFIGYFWNKEATQTGFATGRICLLLAPFFGFTSLGIYFILTHDFGPHDNTLNFGPLYFIALFATVGVMVSVLLMVGFVNSKAEKLLAEKHKAKDAALAGGPSGGIYYGYGGAEGYGSMAPPGYSQGYGTQPPPSYGAQPQPSYGQPPNWGPPQAYGARPPYNAAPPANYHY